MANNKKCGCPKDNMEVGITKKFYDEIREHLDNTDIHMSEEDRERLDFLEEAYPHLVTVGVPDSPNDLNTILEDYPHWDDIPHAE